MGLIGATLRLPLTELAAQFQPAWSGRCAGRGATVTYSSGFDLKGLRNGVVLAVVAFALSGCNSLHNLTQDCNADTGGYMRATSMAPSGSAGNDPPKRAARCRSRC